MEMYDVITGSPTQWFDLKSLGRVYRMWWYMMHGFWKHKLRQCLYHYHWHFPKKLDNSHFQNLGQPMNLCPEFMRRRAFFREKNALFLMTNHESLHRMHESATLQWSHEAFKLLTFNQGAGTRRNWLRPKRRTDCSFAAQWLEMLALPMPQTSWEPWLNMTRWQHDGMIQNGQTLKTSILDSDFAWASEWHTFVGMLKIELIKKWGNYQDCGGMRNMPSKIFSSTELVLVDGEIKEIDRDPGQHNIGMIAWRCTLCTPEYPEGRDIVSLPTTWPTKLALSVLMRTSFSRRHLPMLVRKGCHESTLHATVVRAWVWLRSWSPFLRWNGQTMIHPRALIISTWKSRIWRACQMTLLTCTSSESTAKSTLWLMPLSGRDWNLLRVALESRTCKEVDSLQVRPPRPTTKFSLCLMSRDAPVGIGAYLNRLGQRVIQMVNGPMILTGLTVQVVSNYRLVKSCGLSVSYSKTFVLDCIKKETLWPIIGASEHFVTWFSDSTWSFRNMSHICRLFRAQQTSGEECVQLSRPTWRATGNGAQWYHTWSGHRRHRRRWGHPGLVAPWLHLRRCSIKWIPEPRAMETCSSMSRLCSYRCYRSYLFWGEVFWWVLWRWSLIFLIFALFTAVVLLFDKLLVSFTKLRSYVPKTTAEIPPILEPMDPVSREVTFMPSKTPYDPRHMLEGKACKLQPGYFKGF